MGREKQGSNCVIFSERWQGLTCRCFGVFRVLSSLMASADSQGQTSHLHNSFHFGAADKCLQTRRLSVKSEYFSSSPTECRFAELNQKSGGFFFCFFPLSALSLREERLQITVKRKMVEERDKCSAAACVSDIVFTWAAADMRVWALESNTLFLFLLLCSRGPVVQSVKLHDESGWNAGGRMLRGTLAPSSGAAAPRQQSYGFTEVRGLWYCSSDWCRLDQCWE